MRNSPGRPAPLVSSLLSWGLVAALCGAFVVTQCACIVGATRIGFGAAVIADGVTTGVGLNNGATEVNPVISWNFPLAMTVSTALLVWICETLIRSGHRAAGLNLYRVAAALHGLAAAWNVTQIAPARR